MNTTCISGDFCGVYMVTDLVFGPFLSSGATGILFVTQECSRSWYSAAIAFLDVFPLYIIV